MIYHDIEQNTDAWLQLRKGHFTASAFNDLFMKPETAGYRNCIAKVAYERKTNELLPEKSFSNMYTDIGHEREQQARDQYMMETFSIVKNGGFCEIDEWVGCSPDGLVDNNGLIQIKCPKFSTIAFYKQNKKLPIDYDRQMQGELWVTDREWNDYYVFYPMITPFTIRLYRNDFLIKEIEKKVEEAKVEVLKLIEIL